jgi:anaerobic ribonucleoside-triphosphate reductase activating protein
LYNSDKLYIAGVIKESIVDGPGYRYTVFAQGCPHHCEGCHNPQTHPFSGGREADLDAIAKEIGENVLLKGVTFSGGEPFCQAKPFTRLARLVHNAGKDVISYSGYTFEELLAGANEENGWRELLENIDYLVDGKFILAEKTLLLKFRGSRNQRIIDVPASLPRGEVILAPFND